MGKLANLGQPVRTERKERRKYRRIATDQVISFAPVDERDVLGVGRDVSSGGIRFEAVGCEIDPSAQRMIEELTSDAELV